MDLITKIEDTTLYIRVAGIIKTKNGFLFEKSKDGYIFTLGGKIKINENSKEAIKREMGEEIDFEINNFKLCSVIENFYSKDTEKVHEICFVYDIDDIFEEEIPEGFVEVAKEDFDKYDIKPDSIVDLINNTGKPFRHVIQKRN